MSIKNKVVIVTGASSGIGLATVRLLADHGANVALVARSKNKLVKLSKELVNSFPWATDMTNEAEVKKMVQAVLNHYGKIDILVNCAGQGYDAAIEKTDTDTLRHIFELDFVGPMITMQQVIPIMKVQGEGSIVNISSGTALMHLPNMGAYAAIKSAIAHFSLTARQELKRYGIDVSVVYPYITVSNFEKNTIKGPLLKDKVVGIRAYEPPEADSAEFIAKKIVKCIQSGKSEVFAHDWMKPSG